MLNRFSAFSAGTLLICGAASPVMATNGPYIFDWGIRDNFLPGFEVVTPVPHPGHDWPADHAVYTNLYDQLLSQDRPIALMLQDTTNPINGSRDPDALKTILDSLPRLDFVFADIETYPDHSVQDNQMLEVIRQVRSHPNPNINSAYIGNYNDFPGKHDYSQPYSYSGSHDRSDRDTFYHSSGTNIANPSIYPYEPYEVHTWSLWGSDVSPNKRSALFWAPLERLSVAKRNLPEGHLLIPWTARAILFSNYDAPIPPREDVMALIQHTRLRGADGYYRLVSVYSDEGNFIVDPTEESQNRQDMLDGWMNLDSLFSTSGEIKILNLDTNKTGGLEWSGVWIGDQVGILISNLGNVADRVLLPDIPGLPEYSDYVQPNQHLFMVYTVVPEPAMGALCVLLSFGLLNRRTRSRFG